MSTINKILVPFDFSEASVNALDYTLNFVGPNRNIKVVALYVSAMPVSDTDQKGLEKDFKKLVDGLERRVKNNPEIITATGQMIPSILSNRKEKDMDLVLMGTMGDKVTDEAITNTSRLVLEANCPVISIPYGCPIKEPGDIALVMGGEEIEDKEVLKTLLDLARTFNARVHVLTIYKESVYEEKSVVDRTENLLEYYLEHFYVEHAFNKNQDVEEGILEYINEKNIDMLAILPRNHVEKSAPSEGRLTKLLTLHSEIPVLTLD